MVSVASCRPGRAVSLENETEALELDQVACREALLLKQLETLKQKLIALDTLPQRSQYAQLQRRFADQQAQLRDRHRQNKTERKTLREAISAGLTETERNVQLTQLAELSRRDGRERRSLKQQRDQALEPLRQAIAQADLEMAQLKQRYRDLSKQLQIELRQAYRQDYAANTAGSHPSPPLVILYEDEWLIAVDKPAGLLSVPGRSRQTQDSVLSRLQCQRRDQRSELNDSLQTVHRLDQDTSGILLLAKDKASQRHLQEQFQQQQVSKSYEALLNGQLAVTESQSGAEGLIDLPLAADPDHRPRQRVDYQQGKSSQTHFRLLAQQGPHSRVRFEPQTGRTHQLRVHAAVGLGLAIVGDRLYGPPPNPAAGNRLCLHACELRFRHPATGMEIELRSPVPF